MRGKKAKLIRRLTFEVYRRQEKKLVSRIKNKVTKILGKDKKVKEVHTTIRNPWTVLYRNFKKRYAKVKMGRIKWLLKRGEA